MISKHLMEPHLKTLWWWQRVQVLDVVKDCLESLEAGDNSEFWKRLDQLRGKPKRVAMLCLKDCLSYVQFTGNQLLEALGESR